MLALFGCFFHFLTAERAVLVPHSIAVYWLRLLQAARCIYYEHLVAECALYLLAVRLLVNFYAAVAVGAQNFDARSFNFRSGDYDRRYRR
jgi:hypothetical protein